MAEKNESKEILREYRCKECGKLLFRGILKKSRVEIKCRRCGKINLFENGNAKHKGK